MTCPHCGLSYSELRTGLTFAEVKSSLWVANPDSSTWQHKRRGTVLGKWREIKLALWAEHLRACEEEHGDRQLELPLFEDPSCFFF